MKTNENNFVKRLKEILRKADEQAFPITGDHIHSEWMDLTKREYFAGMAMQALISKPSWNSYEVIAERAVRMADELLKELENQNEG